MGKERNSYRKKVNVIAALRLKGGMLRPEADSVQVRQSIVGKVLTLKLTDTSNAGKGFKLVGDHFL